MSESGLSVAGSPTSLRLAVVSTPRSGNTWVRNLLAGLYDLPEVAPRHGDGLDWDALPPRVVVQIHQLPDAPFLEGLARHGFRVVVLARHPLDVLLSWLNFNAHTHEVSPGCAEGCGECEILGATPVDEAFYRYAAGPKGSELLGYSPAWWDRDDIHRLVYEDFAADPAAGLAKLVDALGVPPCRPIAEVVAANGLSSLRSKYPTQRHHFWQARPGHWREYLPPAHARRLALAHAGVFDTLGYRSDADDALTPDAAEAAWLRVQLAGHRRLLAEERERSRAHSALAAAEASRHLALWERDEAIKARDRDALQSRRDLDALHEALWRAGLDRDAAREESEARQAEILRLTWEVGALSTALDQTRTDLLAAQARLAQPPRERISGPLGPWFRRRGRRAGETA